MRLRRQVWLRALRLAHVLICLGVPAKALADPPSVEAFASLPAQTQAALSPDGHWIAWIDYRESKPRVLMFDLEARRVQRILGVPEKVSIHGIAWHNNQTLLMVLSETTETKRLVTLAREHTGIIAQDVTGGDGRMLPMPVHGNKAAPLAVMVAPRLSKPYTVIMSTRDPLCGISGGPGGRVQARDCLLEVDTRTGRNTIVKFGQAHTMKWIVDSDGKPLARADWDWMAHQYRVYALDPGDSVRELFRSDDAEPPELGGALADRSALVLFTTNGRPHQAAWALPLDGSPLRLLAESANADITRVYTDPYTGGVIGVYEGGSGGGQQWLEAAAQSRHQSLAKVFPNRVVEPYSWTEDGTKTLARVSSPSLAPLYYLIDFKTHRADIAAEEYPALANAALGDFQEITYKARDGTEILAYLTLPPGKPASPVPLIVYPHDGPHDRDYPVFDWQTQLLATRGYAVVRPQYRGSTGFGQAFREAGYRQWGGRVQDDLTDAVHVLVERGIADPHRVCIVGNGGYGGYAALAGAAFTPDVYACAVSINGIADLPVLMRTSLPHFDCPAGMTCRTYSTSQSEWEKRIGEARDPNLAAKSPINAVKTIRAPILIMYGAETAVPMEQSRAMVDALRNAGKNATVVTLPIDTEWWVRSSSRVQLAQELDKFLAANLRPDTAAATAH